VDGDKAIPQKYRRYGGDINAQYVAKASAWSMVKGLVLEIVIEERPADRGTSGRSTRGVGDESRQN